MSPPPPESAAARIGPAGAAPGARRSGLGSALVAGAATDGREIQRAEALARRSDATLRDVLLAHGLGSPEAILAAEAERWGTASVDLRERPPDPRLIAEFDPVALLRAACVPWRRVAGITVFACARPEGFARFLDALPGGATPAHMVLATEAQVAEAVETLDRDRLVRAAETTTPLAFSARALAPSRSAPTIGAALGGFLIWGLVAPGSFLLALSLWAVLTLLAVSALRLACALAHLARRRAPEGPAPVLARLPVVSVLVPLLREEAIAERLLRRLRRVDYPSELLDILLVVEEDDAVTRRTLEGLSLPPTVRVVRVPKGSVKTKPRALNYALPRCRGSIVGVWDAEDMPAPDQIRRVVQRFARRGPEVACLQGRLDYYNARHNVVSRLFTVEYATWFRLFLPGLERLGLPVPLGGTTLFLRREAVEAVGGWDAHNVTEDADLGLRLARRGYRTEVIDTVTHEEANSRPLPWIRQRSRWHKGFAVTWAVHMRRPRALWRDLGPWGFLGVQAIFLATLSQFALAPLLYLFGAAALGAPHPLSGLVPPEALAGLGALFLAAQALDWLVAAGAVSGRRHRHLLPWVPLLSLYYVMATVAVWKALLEVAFRPFYWDKTEHGAFHGPEVEPRPEGVTPPRGPRARRR